MKYPWVARYTLPISAAGDSLFFTSAADGRVVCLDAASGKTRWEFLAGCGVNRVPTFWKGRLYAGSHGGYVYCLDAQTGKVIWTFKAAPADRWFISYGKPVSVWPVRTDVVIDADPAINGGKAVAYFAAGVFPHDGTFLYAIDAETGERIWRNATHAESGWRASMAPAGYLYITEKTIAVPRDFWGYFSGWGTLIMFTRATGLSAGYTGQPPVYGVSKDDVQYFGTHATRTVPGKKKGEKPTQTQLWRENVPGRWTDLDSVLGVRYKRPVFFRWDPELSSVIHAGGVVYSTAFETDAKKGTGTGIYARDPKDGKLLWSADVAEQANQIIVANGRLFAATRQGTIYCFAPEGAKKYGVIDEPVDEEPFEGGETFAPAAEAILKQTGVNAGYALVLDCDSGALAYELAKRTKLYVVAAFRDAEKAAAARKAYSRAAMHVSRIVAYHQKEGTKLPFTSYIADLIVSEAAITGGQLPKDTESMARMLKPIRGVALIGGKQSEEALRKWAGEEKGWKILADGDNQWARRVRPALEDSGGWTHAFGDAGHTGCSHDGALKPPLGIYWYGEPQLGYPGPGALMIDGIFLLARGNDLVAYDEYTGREMWRRAHGRTDTVCGPGSVFMRYLEVIVRLDPGTGKELQSYRPPFPGTKWLAMAATCDGKTLHLVAGGKADGKDWRCIMAMDVAAGRILWTLGGPGKGTRWGGWNAIGDGRIYSVSNSAISDAQHKELAAEMKAYLEANDPKRAKDCENSNRKPRLLTAHDAATGALLYQRAVDIARADQWVAARNGKVIFSRTHGAKWWGSWGDPNGQEFRFSSLAVHDGATGKLLWKKAGANYRFQPVVTDDTIFAEPWAFDLQTGKRRQRPHPITGTPGDYAWVRYGKQCGGYNGSTHFIFGRSKGFGYFDTLRDNGFYVSWHHRQACDPDTASGGGMMLKAPMNIGCGCPWSLPYTIAMTTMPDEPAIPYTVFQAGANVPVKQLRINFGASGDRRDKAGNQWLNPAREQHPSRLQLLLPAVITYYGVGVNSHGGANTFSRRSSSDVPAENTSDPFLFDAYALGLQRFAVPVTTPQDGKGTYTIRLGFSALPGDKPGQRVFDVRLNGKTVLRNFDIVKEAGKPHRAVWKEFTVTLKDILMLDLVSDIRSHAPKNMPVINAMEILRKEFAAFGLKAPRGTWVNERKLETTVEVRVANHRNAPATVKLVALARGGIEVTLPDGGVIALGADEEKRIKVGVKNSQPAKTGSHTVTLQLVSDSGKVERRHALTVDCLGKLERRVQRGQGRWCMTRKTYETWIRRGSPAHYLGRFPASKGAREPGDLGAACSSVRFHVPQSVGKIHRLRVRLHVSPELQAGWRAMFGAADARPSTGGWGRFRFIDSPTDVNVDSLKYPELPKLLPGGYALEPTRRDPNVVEASLPTNLKRDKDGQGRVQLILEPTALNGPVYCGPSGHNVKPENAPQLVIDYEPASPKAKK